MVFQFWFSILKLLILVAEWDQLTLIFADIHTMRWHINCDWFDDQLWSAFDHRIRMITTMMTKSGKTVKIFSDFNRRSDYDLRWWRGWFCNGCITLEPQRSFEADNFSYFLIMSQWWHGQVNIFSDFYWWSAYDDGSMMTFRMMTWSVLHWLYNR